MDPSNEDRAAHARFLETASRVERALSDALERIGPVTMPDRGELEPGDFLTHAVVGQQLSTKAARSIRARLSDAAAEAGHPLPRFAAEVDIATLRACGLSRNKARTLKELAMAEEEGRLSATRLKGLDYQALSDELRGIWGIGQWTCDMAAIFWAGCPDVWPRTDAAVQRTFRTLIGSRRSADRAAAGFAPERSRLAVYMWRWTDAEPD